MGNYCCSEYEQTSAQIKFKVKKIQSIDFSRQNYQQKLLQTLRLSVKKTKKSINIIDFKIISKLGKGSQGSVYMVQIKQKLCDSDQHVQVYAMKRIPKKKYCGQGTKKCILLEQKIMKQNKSQFMTHLNYSFQDKAYYYDLMDIAEGGDLFSYFYKKNTVINPHNIFHEDTVKFILAGVILSLEQLHSKDIIYRDLKPENILISSDGYPKLTDFGVCVKKNRDEKLCYEVKGTLLYFSPQMKHKRGYDESHDLWCLGILAYELLFLKLPFSESTIKSYFFSENVQKWEKQPLFPQNQTTQQAKSFIKALLKNEPQARLGYKSMDKIKSHPFYENFNWNKYEKKILQSPLKRFINKSSSISTESTNITIDSLLIQSPLLKFPLRDKNNSNKQTNAL